MPFCLEILLHRFRCFFGRHVPVKAVDMGWKPTMVISGDIPDKAFSYESPPADGSWFWACCWCTKRL